MLLERHRIFECFFTFFAVACGWGESNDHSGRVYNFVVKMFGESNLTIEVFIALTAVKL